MRYDVGNLTIIDRMSYVAQSNKCRYDRMNEHGIMVFSKDRGIYTKIDSTKVATGSFYTEKETWLTLPVDNFIRQALERGVHSVLDPFAGDGHLLKLAENRYGVPTSGFDIKGYKGCVNDSLFEIPNIDEALIITNPPYLTNYSARRKRVFGAVAKYFEFGYEDLYQLALDRCLRSARYTVAIVPETFVNSSFPKDKVVLCNILTESPFNDTDNPVCVVCLDSQKADVDYDLYIDDRFATKNSQLLKYKSASAHKFKIVFNDPSGNIGLKAVDGTKAGDKIAFVKGDDFHYPRESVKHSSRLLTYIQLPDLKIDELDSFVATANTMLEEIRLCTQDLVLSPFKGNSKDGTRRRRLDYQLARYLINEALARVLKDGAKNGQAQVSLL